MARSLSASAGLALGALLLPLASAAPQEVGGGPSLRKEVEHEGLGRLGVVYVATGATGEASGRSWRDAFPDLTQALAAAETGEEIWVAAGTYTPPDAASSFVLRSGVSLYGGFDGSEKARHERDWRTNETILSGDVGADDYLGEWFSAWYIHTPNCGHVVVSSGVDASAVLDGFTIANGNRGPAGTPIGDPLTYGSGLYNVGGSPTIRRCTFTHNYAYEGPGAAVYTRDGAPRFLDCRFVENMAYHGSGGALCEDGTGAARIEGCAFTRNLTFSDAMTPPHNGGAVARRSTAPGVILRSTFDQNMCYMDFRPLTTYGGAVSNEQGSVFVQDCVFTGNHAMYGGALSTFRSAQVVNCLFTGNRALATDPSVLPVRGGLGGALLIFSDGPETLLVLDTTIGHNYARKAAGLLAAGQAQLVLQNTIVWGNEAEDATWAGTWGEQIAGAFSGTHDCIQELFGAPPPGADPVDPASMPWCTDQDPLFVSPGADLRLSPGSPCIDAGNVFAVPPSVTSDLDGNPRFVDDPAVPDTGLGPPPVVDLGAYEHPAQGT